MPNTKPYIYQMQLTPSLLKLNKTAILIALISCILFLLFAYNLERTQYFKLLGLYSALFGLFYLLIHTYKTKDKFLTVLAFVFRGLFILAIPNLSQDFYRFIWDGDMILNGFNPYLYTVQSFIDSSEFPVNNAKELYKGMGALNASHFTNYPPINQLCFVLANLLPGQNILNSVIGLRLIIIAADFGTFYFGKKLLRALNLPIHHIFWYLLNPFIIIELTGNLHFEGVMIFFLIWSLYLLHKGKWQLAGVAFAISISTKLIPLMFLPLLFQWFFKRPFGSTKTNKDELLSERDPSTVLRVTDHKKDVIASKIKQSESNEEVASAQVPRNDFRGSFPFFGITRLISFYAIVGGVTLLLFAPFFSTKFISNYAQTVGLWFQNFEFNASIYYLLREIGFAIRGYNEIAIIGKLLPSIVFIYTLYRTFKKPNWTLNGLITSMLLVFACYLFLSTTVHPWYLAMLLILSVFTNYRFPLVWSFTIVLSYLAYMQIGNASKSENLLVIALEYIIVFAAFYYDLKKAKPIPA